MGPLVEVLGQALVWVLDAGVQVTDLVVVHVLKVLVMEVRGKTFTESDGEQLGEVLHR